MKARRTVLAALALILTIMVSVLTFPVILGEAPVDSEMGVPASGFSSVMSETACAVFNHVIVDNADYAIVRSVGDVDGDGFSDVIGAKTSAGLSWYKYPSWTKYSLCSLNWQAEDIESADIDGDGDVDVLGVEDLDEVCWFENPRPSGNPEETWASHYIGSDNGFVRDLEIADFDRDGKLDVVIRVPTAAAVFLQNSPTSWTKVKSIPFESVVGNTVNLDGLDVGDLDGDGDLDLVLNGFWVETPSDLSGGVWIEHNIDSKWWSQNTGGWQDNNAKVRVADINEDGHLDVLISQSEKPGYPVSWYEASDPKNGPWIEHVIAYVDYCHTLQVGDVNNDGYLDVVAGKFERHDGAIPPPYPLYVFCNGGDGLSWDVAEVSDLGIYTGVIGDIGNDGDLDIVSSRSYWKGPVEIWENTINDVNPVHLLLTVEPSQSTYTGGQALTFTVNVFSHSYVAFEPSLALTVTGPAGYGFFDVQPILVPAGTVGEYSFTWAFPEVAGTYVVEVSLVPAQLTAYDEVWLKVV
jgi:hypothetical protein